MANVTLSSLSSHYDTLPQWAAMVKKLLLIQPGSAAVERLPSLLSNLSLQQERAREDCIEASEMIRFNSSKRKDEN